MQRTLATGYITLFAGTNYLARHGEPTGPRQLESHRALCITRDTMPGTWRLQHLRPEQEDFAVNLKPRLVSEDVRTLQKAAIDAHGVLALPPYVCEEDVRAGRMRRVLPDWSLGSATMTSLIPHRQGMLPSVQVFLDHLVEEVPKIMIV